MSQSSNIIWSKVVGKPVVGSQKQVSNKQKQVVVSLVKANLAVSTPGITITPLVWLVNASKLIR